MVGVTRIELARVAPLDPKSSASAYSATCAGVILIKNTYSLRYDNEEVFL